MSEGSPVARHAHPRRRRGAMKVGCGLAVAVVLLILLVAGGSSVGRYNGIVSRQEGVEAAWSEIQNQYQRRYDLVPQLVETVRGAADFEQSVLTEVTEARASVGRAEVRGEVPTDPNQLQAWLAAQQALGGALQRLLVVSERYPELRTSQAFLTLQSQLEGTENRIAVARRDHIEAVRGYNTAIRSFPGNLLAGMFGFEKAASLEVDPAVRERPEIDFGRRRGE
jgi:LemA protein